MQERMQEYTISPVTKTAIDKMHAYFNACERGASRREKERLQQEWLNAVRRLRS
jgi:hypothetical protein